MYHPNVRQEAYHPDICQEVCNRNRRDRTAGLPRIRRVLFQLSYAPMNVDMTGVEPASYGLKARCITVLLHIHSTLYRIRTCFGGLGILCPILLNEQGVRYSEKLYAKQSLCLHACSVRNSNPHLEIRGLLSYPFRRTERIF